MGTDRLRRALRRWVGERAHRGASRKYAAARVIRSHSAFGTFYRRAPTLLCYGDFVHRTYRCRRAQLGPMHARVATAHKTAALQPQVVSPYPP